MSASQHPAVAAADVAQERDDWGPGRLVLESRARAQSVKHPVLSDVGERVDYIIGLMGDDVWNPQTSRLLRKKLSSLWGVADSTIQTYSSEAHHAIERAVKECRAPLAGRAIARLEHIGSCDPYCEIPGVASAAVRANEVILKATGYAEPEEDKQRPTTLVQVGQLVTSPVFATLLAGHAPKELNGTNGKSHANGSAGGSAEDVSVVPGGNSDGAVVGDPRKRD